MTRIAIVLATFVLALGLLGCGGGKSIAPAPDNGARQVVTPLAPTAVHGSNSISIVPRQLHVLTGASTVELNAIVSKYGYSVIGKNHGWATLQLPQGTDLDLASSLLEKEYAIASVEPVHQINTPLAVYDTATIKSPSFTPRDPWFGGEMGGLRRNNNGTPGDNTDDFWDIGYFLLGQAEPMNEMGFNGAWDVALNTSVAPKAVKIAIIDAGFFDYSVSGVRAGFDDTKIDAANSGYMAADGTFTSGLTAATWDVADDGDPTIRDFPYRDTGELMLGVIAATINDYFPRAIDMDGNTTIEPTEVWNEGIAGINPNASLVLIKTGELNVDTWSFTDDHLAHSIDQAVTAGANIILLGMFGTGAVGANLSTAIQNARDNNVLVIAPAGDVVASADPGTGEFTDTPVDISVTPVSPASDPNVVSVCGTGYNRVGALPDQDFGGGPIANDGEGWWPLLGGPLASAFDEVATYCNSGGVIAASSFGVGFTTHPYFIFGSGTVLDPVVVAPGENYITNYSNFSSSYSAAYVAGAASIVFQAWTSSHSDVPPTDDEVLNELLSTVLYGGIAGIQGVNGGLLNAGAAAFSAVNGGGLQTVLPAMTLQSAVLSQPLSAVTRATDVSLTVTVADGTAPFKMEVDWGDGNGYIATEPWVNGDPVTLTGGYEELGANAINFRVTDDNGLVVGTGFVIFVINPLSMGITVTDVTGAGVGGNPVPLAVGTSYRFSANPTNVYTGDIGGTPNTTTFSWDFNGDATEDATGTSPVYAFGTAGAYTLTLTVTEAVRPDTVWTVDVQVN